MKTKLILSLSAGVAALVAGCATPLPPGAERGPHNTMAYDVLVEASEPGARIEANGAYIGDSPVHLKIFGDPDGTFHDFGSYYYVVRAMPMNTNQFPQARYFMTGHMMSPEDRVPQKIYFDMNHPPAQANAPYGPPGYAYPPPAYYYGYPYPYYGPGVNVYVGPRWRRW
jgi:hypothetical protein